MAIQSLLHLIPGLAPWYVVAEDDYFYYHPFDMGQLFFDRTLHKPVVGASKRNLSKDTAGPIVVRLGYPVRNYAGNGPWEQTSKKTASLLSARFTDEAQRPADGWHGEIHSPFLANKCLMKFIDADRQFAPALFECRRHRERMATDVSMMMLYGSYVSAQGYGVDSRRGISGDDRYLLEFHGHQTTTAKMRQVMNRARTEMPFVLNVQNFPGAFEAYVAFMQELHVDFPLPSFAENRQNI